MKNILPLNQAKRNNFFWSVLTAFSLILISFMMVNQVQGQNCTVNAGVDQSVCANTTMTLIGVDNGLFQGSGNITWTQVSGPSVTIVSPHSLTTVVTGFSPNSTYTFMLSAKCLDGSLVTDIVNYTVKPITIANAGPDQTICPGSGTLAANSPAGGESGLWTVVSGSGVSITTPSSPTSAITVSQNGSSTATLRWTITGPAGSPQCFSQDDMIITNPGGVMPVTAGPNQSLSNCYSSTTSTGLAGSYGGNGINGQHGTWTILSGPNIPTFGNANQSNTSVSNLIQGTYTLQWSVSGPCANGSATMTITVPAPTANVTGASASSLSFCDGRTSFVLTGNDPLYSGETVHWAQTSGPAATIDSPNTPITSVTVPSGTGSYSFSYTISNLSTGCSSSATANVTYNVAPSITITSGSFITLPCGDSTATVNYTETGSGTVQWSILSGPTTWFYTTIPTGYQNASASPQVIPHLSNAGTYVIRFRKTPGVGSSCSTVYADISIIVSKLPTASNAGTAQLLACNVFNTSLAANVPVVGTGQWSQVSGPNMAVISNPNLNTSSVSGFINGVYIFRWLISAGPLCPTTQADVKVIVASTTPTQANAGLDQTVCFGTSLTLQGNTPILNEVGTWTVVPSAGLTFSDIHAPHAIVNGLIASTVYTFTWTITNACGTTSDNVLITTSSTAGPTQANAGPDQCLSSGTTTMIMAGNNPAPGTGLWTRLTGPNSPTITTPSLNTTTVTGLVNGTYTFEWTITFGSCAVSQDTMKVTISAPATTANAGGNQNICGTSVTLNGNTPVVGTGLWTQEVGNAGATIVSPTSPTTLVTGLIAGVYVFRWTISNQACPGNYSDATIYVSTPPSPAVAGPNQTLCGSTSTNMAATPVTIGTGIWLMISGPNTPTIANYSSPTTMVSGMITGVYVFRWSVSNGPNCPVNTSDVTITIYENANAGPDQTYCDATTVNLTGNVASTGTWTQVGTTPNIATITTTGSNTATASGLITGVYTFQYTITGAGGCSGSSATMHVTISGQPAPAVAGPDQDLCGAASFTFAATPDPVPGGQTGTWTQIYGPGGGSFSDNHSPHATFNGAVPGLYVFVWTISQGGCSNGDQVRITNSAPPTSSDAGPTQDVCGTIATMAANTPVTGTGNWSQISGPNTASITSLILPYTTITGLIDGTYVFRWTISNPPCPSSSSDVTINDHTAPTPANAGPDQSLCNVVSATLAGNVIITGSGLWTQTSGPAATITTPSSNNSTVTGLTAPGVYQFTWTSTIAWTYGVGSCTTSDVIQITNNPLPSTAYAGPDQSVCLYSPVTLAATAPIVGIGTWTQTSGPTTVTFADVHSPTTTVNGVDQGVYTFRWTVVNDGCPSSFDDVDVTMNPNPTIAIAGPNQILCNGNTATMAANTPDPGHGTGTWSQISGPVTASITSPNSPTTTITGITTAGVYVFQWEIATGPICISDDQMQVTRYSDVIITSPSNATICTGGTQTLAVSASGGTGSYTYQWQQSANGTTGWGNVVGGSGATTSSYTTAVLSSDLYYRCIVTCTCGTAISAVAHVTVVPDPTITADPVGSTICSGNTWGLSVTASGGTPSLNYQWQYSTTGCSGWSNIGSNSPNYTTASLTQTTYYHVLVSAAGNGCNTATSACATVYVPVITTQPAALTSICDGGLVTLTTAAAGGTATFTYQWESSPTGAAPWTPIGGETTASYTTPTLTVGEYYYHCVISVHTPSCADLVTNSAHVHVVADPSFTTQTGDQSICVGGTYTFSVTPAGGVGAFLYQWENASGCAGPWTVISGANASTYIPPLAVRNAAGTYYYHCIVTQAASGCSSTSNCMTLTVVPDPAISIQPTGSTICSGTTYGLSVTASGGTPSLNYQWQYSTSGCSGWSNIGGNSNSYTTAALTQTTYYHVIISATGSDCNTVTSNCVTVFVPRILTQPTSSSICDGGTATMSVVMDAPGTATFNYQWQVSAVDCSVGFNNIPGATSNTYTTPALTGNRFYQCLITVSTPTCTTLVTNCVSVTVVPDPYITGQPAGGTICTGSTYTMSVAASGGTPSLTYQWQNSGALAGPYTNVVGGVGANTATYTTPALATTTYYQVLVSAAGNGCGTATSVPITVAVSLNATANAGGNNTICSTGTYTIAGSFATNYISLLWTTSGTGTFNNPTALHPVYTPSAADITLGSATLTLTAYPAAPCTNASNSMLLSITKAPVANAGSNATICSGSTYTLSDATASNYASLQWTRSGTGTFNNATILNPIYTPSAADITAGTVTLTLTANANAPCANAVSNMTLSISKAATANAGGNNTICSTGSYSIAGATATNYTSLLWTTSGTGTYNNPTALNPVYTPSVVDITAGTVTLTLTAYGIAPCPNATNNMTLTIVKAPAANAGSNTTICSTGTYTLSGANASNYASLTWTTSGTGSFNNATILNPVYTPSAADITAGTVTLTLTANANAPCANAISSMTLSITKAPTANAGGNSTICSSSTYPISTASATNYSSLLWTTSGTGTFNNQTIINPVYTPSAADITAGTVTLTLTANANSPCANVSNSMTLSITKAPIANAGPNGSTCQGTAYTVSGASASSYLTILWTAPGPGALTNAATLTPTYTPTAGQTGSVILTLTANPNAGCSTPAVSTMTLTIVAAATANAGGNHTICSTGNYSITTSTATNYSSLLWTTSGTGIFNNPTSINPIYTPSPVDITAGTVNLTLTAYANAPCTNASNAMTLTINTAPVANAGPNQTFCSNITSATMAANSPAPGTGLWTKISGPGSPVITNPTSNTTTITSLGIGVSVFRWTVSNGICTAATSDVTITRQVCVPVAVDDYATTFEDIPVSGNVLTNDSDPNGLPLTVTLFVVNGTTYAAGSTATIPGVGTLVINADGTWTFTPVLYYHGPVPVANYTITNGTNTASANLYITITPGNHPPVANVDYFTTLEDTPVSGNVTGNDTDPDGNLNPNGYALVTGPAHGTISFSNNGTFTYTPGPNYNGQDSFIYSVCDLGMPVYCDTAIVHITITPVNDPPVTFNENLNTCSSSVLNGNILTNGDYDPDGTALTVNTTPVSGPSHGGFIILSNGAFTYTPTAGYGGPDRVILSVCDNGIPLPPACTNDTIFLTVIAAATASAGPNGTICEGSAYTLAGSAASNYTTLNWTTSGTGTFSNPALLHPIYTPSAADITAGSVILTLTANATAPCTNATSSLMLSITKAPLANAGPNATICQGTAFTVSGATASNYASLLWTAPGPGVLTNATTLTPTYTPTAGQTGPVVLTLTANPNPGCSSPAISTMTLTINASATASAGGNASICEGSIYALSGSNATNYISLLWSTSGTGYFNDPNLLHPVYTASAADITAGSVTLTLTANGNPPCGNATSSMTLSISRQPLANAGPNATICQGTALTVSGATASNYASLLWTAPGPGVLTNATTLTPTYTPTAGQTGPVILTLTANPNPGCSSPAISTMTLTINASATASAGGNASICEGSIYALSGSNATNYISLLWSTSGTGYFNDPNLLHPVYTASAADITAGSVTLTLTANGNPPCGNATSSITLSISRQPVANAGPNATICETSTYTLSGSTAQYYASLLWTSSGTGGFNNATILHPIYTPSAADIASGSVVLTLAAVANSPCMNAISTMTLSISRQPVASAGPNATICEGSAYTLAGSSAQYYATLNWTTSGTGTFSNPTDLHPIYTPSAADIFAGSVVLTVQANANTPCSSVTSSMTLSITKAPLANAGPSATICQGTAFTVSGATASNYASILWTAPGPGVLTNATTLIPTYTPTTGQTGNVVLTLTANPNPGCSSPAISTMILTINASATASAGGNASICEGSIYALSGSSASNYISLLWSTSGTGYFNDPNLLHPIYTASAADITAGSVILTLTANGNPPCGNATNSMTLSISRQPVANAGPNATICETSTYTISGSSAQYYVSLLWTSSGTGGFDNATILHPVYTPSVADISAGGVILTLHANANEPCANVTSLMTLSITRQAIANAGPDGTICESSTFTLVGATAQYYTFLEWITLGNGNFNNEHLLNATYTPSPADIAAGSVKLILHLTGIAPCVDANDTMTLTISRQAIANAGPDATICETSTYTVSSSAAQNYTTLNWTSSGSGGFNNATILHPVYTPSAADIAAGSVNLILHLTSSAPCGNATDTMVLNINRQAIANAGPDATICETSTYLLSGSSASHYSFLEWVTTGTGYFNNDEILHPTYAPSPADIAAGNVQLILHLTSVSPCVDARDTMILTITRQAIANAGPDATICETSTYTVSSSAAQYYTSLNWTTSGTGTFSNSTILHPVYTPSAADIAAGSIMLTLNLVANVPCANTSSSMMLSISHQAIVNAGPNATICEGSTYQLNGSTTQYATNINWTTSGTGTFSNIAALHPVYTPSMADILGGTVTLTITVTSNPPCANASSFMILTINRAPIANAGPNSSTCQGVSFMVTLATAQFYTSLLWTAPGPGVLINATTLNPTYSPAPAQTGPVVLTLTVFGNTPCGSVASQMTLNIIPAPLADAGPNSTICEGSAFTVLGSSASYYSSLLWTTNGTGTFVDPTILHPTYNPSTGDVLAGNLKLFLRATGNAPCTFVKDSLTLTIVRAPVANAGPDGTTCQGLPFIVSGATAQFYSTLLWTDNGAGTLGGATTLTPTYIPAPYETGPVTLTLTVTGNQPCGTVSDQMTLNITPAPEADAGPDVTICEGSAYTITGATASNYDGILWASNGLGTLTNANTLTPTYFPATNEVGTITLTLTVYGYIPCGTITDFMLLQITPKATADAGPDIFSCDAVPVTLAAATATNYISLEWNTSGSGTFNNQTTLNPVYTPSLADILNGHVILTLTAVAGDPCPAATDNMTLTISKEAVANAGPDQSTCEGVSYMILGASAQNYTSILWTHNGMGTLTGANTITPTYNPAAGETGQVTLTLTVTPVTPCQAVTDQMILTISQSATADAGPDATSCGPDPFMLSGASATNYSALIWTTSGTGTFNDPNIVNPVYTPSLVDILSGHVVLTLTIDPIIPCAIATDYMTLTLAGFPVANAGPDGLTCAGIPFTVTGATAVNYSTILWTTNGLGVISGSTTLMPTYTPAPGESGTVTMTLTLHGAGGCTSATATSQMNILIGNPITVNAGNDQTIPRNSSTTLIGLASGGSGQFAFHWQPATLLIGASTDHPETVKLVDNVTFILTVTDIITGCQNTDSVRIFMDQGIEAILAVRDYDTTAVNIPIDIGVLTNDTYSRNLTVGVTLCGGPEHGLANVFSDNMVRYTPNQDFSGIDSLCYIVCYNQYPELCDTTEVYIFISSDSPVNWLIIRNVITPNGDGINDGWIIDGIERFPDNTILIFNRWGDKVNSFEHYNNTSQVWKGDNYKGEPLPDGTYYYILKIRDGGTRTGWVWIRGSSR